jgi:metal-responsive CopG/Arc/MetJ family transcriptional regulator
MKIGICAAFKIILKPQKKRALGDCEMEKILVSLPEGIFNTVHELKGKLGESDSEVVRTMVISFLSEKGYLAKREKE